MEESLFLLAFLDEQRLRAAKLTVLVGPLHHSAREACKPWWMLDIPT